jgi:predicted O-linked N-acetylglucosamine transferase (SPINDLY family)
MAVPIERVAQWINAAHAASATGDFAAAARWAEQATRAAPQIPEGWYNLAIALRGLGRRSEAVRAAKRAAKLTGEAADAQNSIGLELLALDAIADARRCFERALALDPRHAYAHCNLGMLKERLRQFAEAEGSFRRAIALQPDLAPAHANLCGILNANGEHEAAAAAGRRAVELDARSAVAWTNLGAALTALRRHEDAEAACRKAVALAPYSGEAWTNLGLALAATGRYEAAGPACRRAVELDPRSPGAWRNLAGVLLAIRQTAAAEAALRRAVELDPGFAAGWSHLAEVLIRQFRLREAEACCDRAIALDSKAAAPHALIAQIHAQRWDFGAADAAYQRALAREATNLGILSHRLYMLNTVPTHTPSEMLEAALQFGAAARRNVEPFTAWACPPERERRLRIGLVSGDFYRHPVGHFLTGPLRAMDRNAFELFAYSSNLREDEVTAELRQRFTAWRSVYGQSDADLARQIHDDRIDILVDPSGHTEHGHLGVFAWRPAPVQVTWLGYFATTGLREIDWKIGDPWVTPREEEGHFVERVWRLPGSCYCFAPIDGAPAVAALPCLANGHVTYGCFNNLIKLNDEVIALWSRVLTADPAARLLLKSKQLGSAEIVAALRARFARLGVPAERVLLEPAGSYAEYLEAYARVDLALDPFPYTGGTTTVEGLWMGVPALTLRGDRYIGHQGESLLHAAGLPDWIAADRDEYVRKALAFAADRDALAQLRAALRERVAASPLFDAQRFARHLETALRGMWAAWCDAQGRS